MKIPSSIVERGLYGSALLLGALAVLWTGAIFITKDPLAFTITVVIGGVYAIGTVELLKFTGATSTLTRALNATQEKIDNFADWIDRLDPSLRHPVRLRVEGERVGLPAPVLTPYLVGLLVMLGLLGTFVGMVDTLRGAVAALEGSTELQAIRQGLAAPINGLGMAFGTSVAGVATSAMLGLMSTLSRRQRILETRRLDARIPTCFKAFSLKHSQQDTFLSIQRQTESLPAVAGKLEAVADKLDQMGRDVLANQANFQRTVGDRFAQLAVSMDQALKQHLAENCRMLGDAVTPVVQTAMHTIAQETRAVHQVLTQTSQDTLQEFGQQFTLQFRENAKSWENMHREYQLSNDALIARAGDALDGFCRQYEQTVSAMLEAFNVSAGAWVKQQEASDQERIERWQGALDAFQQQAATHLSDVSVAVGAEIKQVAESHRVSFEAAAKDYLRVSSSLAATWQAAGEETRESQKELTASLSQSVNGLTGRIDNLGEHVQREITRLMDSSAELMQSRRDVETVWVQDHSARMDSLTQAIATQLNALRDAEERRGRSAVAHLEKLESALGTHLATLGQALESPMARLIETASEAPRAAARLMEQMRKEAARQLHRDNRLLDERSRIMEQLDTLSVSLGDTLSGQGDAIEQLVASSKGILEAVGRRFADQVKNDVSHLSSAADSVSVSAVEMASLGESFSKAVELFTISNRDLVKNLTRIEGALEKATTRSDDQLGYFVAQAREIIEHSMLSQKEIFEELREMRPKEDVRLEAS